MWQPSVLLTSWTPSLNNWSSYNTYQFNYFWNAGVKYNKELKKYGSSGCGSRSNRRSSGSSAGAAGGGSAGGIIVLCCIGGVIYFVFIKGKKNEQVDEAPPEETPEAPPQTTTVTTQMVAQPQMGMPMQPAMMAPGMVAQPGMVYQDPAMMGMQVQPGMIAPEVPYDEDPRTMIPPYFITKDANFVEGGNYSQIVIADGDTLSYTDAMNKAVAEAQQRGAFGFFYQQHGNGHQIAGFYQTKEDMASRDNWVNHGHKRGCIGTMEQM